MMDPRVKSELVLHGGEKFEGYSFGYEKSVAGEVVFTTGMVGYPESLTDPSYTGQILILTAPMIGNYGIPKAENDFFGVTKHFESPGGKIHVSAVIVQEYCENPDHWENYQSLGSWLKEQKIPGVMMVDTRSIVTKLRGLGTALGKVVINGMDVPFDDPNTRNLVAEVSTKKRVTYGHGTIRILVVDMGVKLNTLRCLLKFDVTLIVVPHDWDISTEQYDGLFISNGPGNPQMCTATIRHVRWALTQEQPIFGICMGNQILALASGGTTYKMKFGHRGQNQPCKCIRDGRVVITTQNHGFAVDFKTMPSDWEEYFINPNDGSSEGLWHKTKPFCSVQFHPEACCGPKDTEYLLDEFVQRVKTAKVEEMKRFKPAKVLVLGAGGIVIAQAGEFDYSGSQCLKSLREEGIRTVLINPNIATVQTDDESADSIYFVPVTPEAVEKVIEKERPDGLLLGWGGQTALNCGLELHQRGILRKYNVRVLGTPVSVIGITEDRELFRDTLLQINEHVAKSAAVTTLQEALNAKDEIGFPMMIRAAFCLGGQGSGIVQNEEELREKIIAAFAIAPQVLMEQSVAGWKEVEYEVIRDIYDNCITVCNMENMDPMGIHTGESIVVAPSQTLSNAEFHMLRTASIKIIRHLGIVGECNIQYGLDPYSHRYVVIEVNARLSRSSALASKATGYPLAHVATKVALGKGLFEITNGVTKTTMACFEPSLDYIAVKIPRWDLGKFNMVSQRIGSMMKSVGEVMAIGRNFEETFQKAIRMTDPSMTGFDVPDSWEQKDAKTEESSWDYMDHIINPTPHRIYALCKALEIGMSVEELYQKTKITRFFLYKLERIVKMKEYVRSTFYGALERVPKTLLLQLKSMGFSDIQIGKYIGCRPDQIRAKRLEWNIMPVVKQIDTVAGEYPAAQCCYLYTSYNAQHDDVSFADRMYAVLGCGVYRIGNSVEFDYGGVLVARELRRLGNKVIMINYNPETVSTDYDECDRLYFEEISEETVLDIFTKERIRGVVISLGGQIVQNMALKLKEAGLPILGTDPTNIDMAEDRNKFSAMCDEIGVPQPEWVSATSVDEVYEFCDRVKYPALVRPSYVLSGSAMAVIANKEDVRRYLEEASLISGEFPVVVSKYYENAMEYDVDIVAHHGRVLCYAICEHVENAGVHSGDATMLLPPQNTSKETMKNIYDAVTEIAVKLDITGPMNVQLLLTEDGVLRVIEANVRSSRSVPFVSKTLGISFPAVMVSVFLAKKERDLVPIRRAKMTHIGCKASMFSFHRLGGADPILGVEMASTGEVGVFGRTKNEVLMKALYCQNFKLPKKGVFFYSEDPVVTAKVMPCISKLSQTLKIFTCSANAKDLKEYGISHELLHLPEEGGKKISASAGKHFVDEVATKEMFDMVIQLRDKKQDFLLRRIQSPEMAPSAYFVRRLAIDFNVALITEPNLLKCFAEAWDITPDKIEIEPFSHYVPKVYHKIENNNCAMLRPHKVGLMVTDNLNSKVLALRLLEEGIDITGFHAYMGGVSDVETVENIFRGMNARVEIVDIRSHLADGAFDLIMCQTMNDEKNWHLSKLARHLIGQHLLIAMREANLTAVAQTSKQNNKEVGFEKYVHLYAPRMGVYNAWRDHRLMEDIASVAEQISYLREHGVPSTAESLPMVHSSICGNTYYCDDVRDLPAPTLVRPLRECSSQPEFVSLGFRGARCVSVNGVACTPLLALNMANEIAGRNGIGLARTRQGAMYESPGMTLFSIALQFLYEVYFDIPSTDLFRTYSRHVSQHVAVGQLHEKHVHSAIEAIRYLTADVDGVVELELHMGDAIFLKLSQLGKTAKAKGSGGPHHGAGKRSTDLVTEEELEEVFLPGNGSFSDIQW